MSFTPSEKTRMALSQSAARHYRVVKNWKRAYMLAGKELKRTITNEIREILAELAEDEEKFISNEFFY